MSQPLQGIRVLDLSRVLAGPYCGMILGDLGADVIKVEAPGGNDDTRGWKPPEAGGESAYYLSTNRNKREICLDLATAQGQEVARRLALTSDVVLDNFKAGTLERFGLDYRTLSADNPRLIQCTITGFGLEGPLAHRPGYDMAIQAMSGLMSITGEANGSPMKVGVALVDVITGLYAVIGILAALQERERSGRGQQVDLALLDCSLAALVNVASNYLVSGKRPRRYGNAHPNVVPYQPFAARDRHFVVAVGNDRQFAQLAAAVGHPEWAGDARFHTAAARVVHRDALIPLLEEAFARETAATWLTRLEAVGVPCAPIHYVDEALEHPHVRARGLVQEMLHPTAGRVRLVGSPLRFSRTPVKLRRHPPLLGEQTDEILAELGYDAAAVAALRQSGAVG